MLGYYCYSTEIDIENLFEKKQTLTRPADVVQQADEALQLFLRSTETWTCPRMLRDFGRLVFAAERLDSRVVSLTNADVLCNGCSPLPINANNRHHKRLLCMYMYVKIRSLIMSCQLHAN